MPQFKVITEPSSAIHEFRVPIVDLELFEEITQEVLSTNPWGCVAYAKYGVNYPPIAKAREAYWTRIEFKNSEDEIVGSLSIRSFTIKGFKSAVTTILNDKNLADALGGSPIQDEQGESYRVKLQCHDQNGEIYNVEFSRNHIIISSYRDDAIKSKIETWVGMVSALG